MPQSRADATREKRGRNLGRVSLWFELDSSIIYLIHYNNIMCIYIYILNYIYNIYIYYTTYVFFLTARNMLGCSNHQIRWIASSLFVSTQAGIIGCIQAVCFVWCHWKSVDVCVHSKVILSSCLIGQNPGNSAGLKTNNIQQIGEWRTLGI